MSLKDQLTHNFSLHSSTNNCLEELNLEVFEIVDDVSNSPCRRVDSNGEFKVENPCCYVLCFLKIDNCILFSDDGKKCDFAVFNDNQLIFVELKRANRNQGKKRRSKAYEQLENTLNIFIGRNFDLSIYQQSQGLFVIASVLDYNLPITEMPVAKTINQNAQVRFEKYEATLLIGQVYEFK